MEKTSHSSGFESHPGKSLEDHLTGVAALAEYFAKNISCQDFSGLKDFCRILALSHDLGKASGYFQDYLHADAARQKKLKTELSSHSLFSAVCAYYLVKEFFSGNDTEYYPFFAYLAVKHHHGNLKDIKADAIFDSEEKSLIEKQLSSVSEENFNTLGRHLFEAGLSIKINKEIISGWLGNFGAELRRHKRSLGKDRGDLSKYLFLNLAYSILIDADKSDVVIGDIKQFRRSEQDIGESLVDNFKAQQQFIGSPLNTLRESAYQEALNKNIDISQKLYSLNLPTGLGKTLTSLAFACKLRQAVEQNTDGTVVPRIIYALPFLSVIEQNANVFRQVIEANKINPKSDLLLKHHHLAEVFYEKNNAEFETDQAKILIEGWNAEIVITTFVQLFHTLVSNKNKSLRKFHRLAGSIIILDEVQAIPIKLWLLIKEIFQLLMDRLNIRIILATATEPLIYEKNEYIELTDGKRYFQAMDRVRITPRLGENITLEELYDKIAPLRDKTYLFIFNTINCAKQFYKQISGQKQNSVFLSTHLTPKDRLRRIEKIKKGEYGLLVTTQLVEAGVDIDFDIVIRDLAPLDCINQSAGRCNRNNRNHKGEVIIVSLKNDNNRLFASYVYDGVLLDITGKILSPHKQIEERHFLKILGEYYREIAAKKSQTDSRRFLEAAAKLRYNSLDGEELSIADFSLIPESYTKQDVFIEQDDQAVKIWLEYTSIKQIENPFERKHAFDKIKGDFYQYVISVPKKSAHSLPLETFLNYVSYRQLPDYYDQETGFITGDNQSIIIW